MTSAAWLMLAVTWTVTVSITGYLFWKVLVTPTAPADSDEER